MCFLIENAASGTAINDCKTNINDFIFDWGAININASNGNTVIINCNGLKINTTQLGKTAFRKQDK
jgi:hypothetical protein